MRLIKRLHLRAERGFSMFIAIMAMAVTAMFVAAAFVAVNGDLPVSGISKERKSAYAAAEAGMAFYLNHLQRDPDYWTLCTDVPPPNATEPSPVNQQWNGAGTDPRTWRAIPESDAQYTIELLHSDGFENQGCVRTDQKSMIDEQAGTFKIRFTGRPSPTSTLRRSIIATFQRDSFLNFVYFTEYETGDPEAASTSTMRTRLQANCADRVRSARTHADCAGNEIGFPLGDVINGPLHTNDESVMICGGAVFGRTRKTQGGPLLTKPIDTAEVRGPLPGYIHSGNSGCGAPPTTNTISGKFTPFAKYVPIPSSNDKLAEVAQNNGKYYTGKTIIRLKGNVMDVTTHDGGVAVTTTNVALPANGVIYVDAEGSCSNPDIPVIATYGESSGCGNVYVSGTYSQSLTIAARRDIIIRPTIGAVLDSSSTDANLLASGDVTLGLVADNFVRVGHKVNRSSGCVHATPTVWNVEIHAAILSTKHSFTVDNWSCQKLDTLTIKGAIAQKYRGVVSTYSGASVNTGYTKNYWYDDRLRYRSPPYFLDPVKSAWGVRRVHEQLPAR